MANEALIITEKNFEKIERRKFEQKNEFESDTKYIIKSMSWVWERASVV